MRHRQRQTNRQRVTDRQTDRTQKIPPLSHCEQLTSRIPKSVSWNSDRKALLMVQKTVHMSVKDRSHTEGAPE